MDSRYLLMLMLSATGLLAGCAPLLKWNRASEELAAVDELAQPEANVSGAPQQSTEANQVASSDSESAPKAPPATPAEQKPADFVDQARGASHELTVEEQAAIEKLIESSPEAARFLARRTSDPTEKNLAQMHKASIAPPEAGSSEGIDLLRESRTMPPPPLDLPESPGNSAAVHPPTARLGTPGPLEEPADAKALAPQGEAEASQLPVIEYGTPSAAQPPGAAGYGGRLPPPEALRSAAHNRQAGYGREAAASVASPETYSPRPYETRRQQAYAPPGYRQESDPRMIDNPHIEPAPHAAPRAAGDDSPYPSTSPSYHANYDAQQTSYTEVEPLPPAEVNPGDWRRQLELAIADLESELNRSLQGTSLKSEASDDPLPRNDQQRLTPLERQELAQLDAQLRMLYLAGGMREAALEPVTFYDTSQQEFWKYAMNGLAVYLDREKHPVEDRRLRLALRDLRQAVEQLAAGSTLDVRNLAFCSKVNSFGSYDEFDEYVFAPGEEVLLYVEVENFTSEQKANGFETTLVGSYRVFDARKSRVADHTFIEETETCRNRRRDYFITYRMWIPKDIAPGSYTLQLTVEDIKGNKAGQASLRFQVAS